MQFNSVEFLLFFPIVLLVYYAIPKKIKYLWLLVSSYFFYMCWNAKYALLLLTSTVITYVSGLLLDKVAKGNRTDVAKKTLKKWIVAGSFISNLGILGYFKYSGFFLESLEKIFRVAHIQLNIPTFDIILPVGISFYTFQALSYTMDVYRSEIYAEKNFFRYALFVSFFPQLVAGPIERSKNLLKQLSEPAKLTWNDFQEGLLMMLWGLFMKMVIADRIAIFVDSVYGHYEEYNGMYLVVATVLFAFQIYCDFAGYSTIAVGAAMILGIRLMENFNAPYLSTSVGQFWRNWHISLTSWFKDYLYIPLGGSKKGKLRKYINKMIVFAVSGLWHGPRVSFILWGILNGIYQVLGEIFKPVSNKIVSLLGLNRNSIGHRLFQVIRTFILVDFSWIFFRATGTKEAIEIVKSMFTVKNYWILFDYSLQSFCLDQHNLYLMFATILLLVFVDVCKKKNIILRRVIIRQDGWFKILFITISIAVILTFGKYGPIYDAGTFIYFQF